MARHETDLLWAHAGGQLALADAARVDEHLRTCEACAQALAQVKAARSLVAAPAVPPLAPAQWKHLDRAVAAAAKKELERPKWLSFLFGQPVFAVAALAACALLMFALWPRPQPREPEVVVAPPRAVPPKAPEREPAAAPTLARVVSAREAGALSANEGVKVGATVGTAKKGELWLSFPDGSRAGVLGGSRLTLAAVEPSRLHLRLEQGSLLVDAAHVEGRAFEVNAGEIDIRVSGTRFLVERIEGRVLVAVSEGSVEVVSGERLYQVPAGRKLTLERSKATPGKLAPREEDELSLLAPLPPKHAAKPEVPPAAELPDESWKAFDAGVDAGAAEVALPALAEAAPDAGPPSDSEFAEYPGASTPPASAPDAGAVVKPAPVATAVQADDAGEKGLIEKLLGFNLESPFPPIGMSMEEYRLKGLQKLADVGQCEVALGRADAWLEAYPGNGTPKRFELRKQVLFTKARCLSKLGRSDEAEAVRRLQ
jgi:hypothetical protein